MNKAERSWRPEEHFDIRHGDAEFGDCSAGFGLPLVQYFLMITFTINKVYPVNFKVYDVLCCFQKYSILLLHDRINHRRVFDLWTFNMFENSIDDGAY